MPTKWHKDEGEPFQLSSADRQFLFLRIYENVNAFSCSRKFGQHADRVAPLEAAARYRLQIAFLSPDVNFYVIALRG